MQSTRNEILILMHQSFPFIQPLWRFIAWHIFCLCVSTMCFQTVCIVPSFK